MKKPHRLVILLFILNNIFACIIIGQPADSRSVSSTQSQTHKSIKELLDGPWGKLFYIERKNGIFKVGDTLSHFNNNKDFEALTFDISNNKVLANVGVQGTLKSLTVYRDTYFANCTPTSGLTDGSWPGVWTAKDNSSYGPYSFTLEIDGKSYDLDQVPWDFRTGLLDNIIPITEFKGPDNGFTIKLVTYAPLSPDGKQRIRGAVYGLYLENKTLNNLSGSINLPKLMQGNRKDLSLMKTGALSWASLDPYDFDLALGDTDSSMIKVRFNLKKRESIWVPAILYNLGDTSLQEINEKGTVICLENSLTYFRNMLGRLKTPEDPYLAEFFERQIMEAFGTVGMSPGGKIAGTNFGSLPATRQVWIKDMIYTGIPFMLLDKDIAKKIILWLTEFEVRPKGKIMEGGINHSVGISMSSLMLAGIYYDATGDKEFFLQNPKLKKYWEKNLTELIKSRKDPDIWLFPSKYISDGWIIPDYHTGSNVCAWFALNNYSRLLGDVYGEQGTALFYRNAAGRVKEAIMQKCTIDGPFGKQFIEAAYRDGREAPMESDGEESDITLMPFYGFLSWDDPVYLNYMNFSVSKYNKIYSPQLHAITWFGVPSTAPGYLKGLCAGINWTSLDGEHGYMTEIRRVTDADGSIWWWAYGWGEKDFKPPYGKVVRGNPGGFGKAGYFSGIYSAIYLARQLGIQCNNTFSTFCFKPLQGSSGFSWSDLSLGGNIFSVDYQCKTQYVKVKIENRNAEKYTAKILLPISPAGKLRTATVNGHSFNDVNKVRYLGYDYLSFSIDLPEMGTITIEADSR